MKTTQTPYGLALLRGSLGLMWISHALLKILVFGLAGTQAFFAANNLPSALVYPVVAAEILGGAAILIGYKARLASLLLLPILAGAVKVHAPNGWVFSSPGGGWEYPLFLAMASLVLILCGSGAFAVDGE
ncbi:DoxX family protein [Oxalobacteraceae bacterium]|nr:DoxX family protein [Oxalobacteraceae bacterium]